MEEKQAATTSAATEHAVPLTHINSCRNVPLREPAMRKREREREQQVNKGEREGAQLKQMKKVLWPLLTLQPFGNCPQTG